MSQNKLQVPCIHLPKDVNMYVINLEFSIYFKCPYFDNKLSASPSHVPSPRSTLPAFPAQLYSEIIGPLRSDSEYSLKKSSTAPNT